MMIECLFPTTVVPPDHGINVTDCGRHRGGPGGHQSRDHPQGLFRSTRMPMLRDRHRRPRRSGRSRHGNHRKPVRHRGNIVHRRDARWIRWHHRNQCNERRYRKSGVEKTDHRTRNGHGGIPEYGHRRRHGRPDFSHSHRTASTMNPQPSILQNP